MLSHGLLSGKRGIIFGALNEKSIAWRVAERCSAEGACMVLTNTPVALRLGSLDLLSSRLSAPVIAADATSVDDLRHLFTESQLLLGGKIDFLLHAVAMSANLRRGKSYEQLNYNYYVQTLDVSALSFHKILQTAYELDALSAGASVVALSYIAAERAVMGYNDMSDAKALLQSIVRNFGLIYGFERGVRINTVSQSPTRTTAGSGISGFDKSFDISDATSPLGNADQDDCASLCVMLFSDYTQKLTMQNIYNDGGFSSVGLQLRDRSEWSSMQDRNNKI